MAKVDSAALIRIWAGINDTMRSIPMLGVIVAWVLISQLRKADLISSHEEWIFKGILAGPTAISAASQIIGTVAGGLGLAGGLAGAGSTVLGGVTSALGVIPGAAAAALPVLGPGAVAAALLGFMLTPTYQEYERQQAAGILAYPELAPVMLPSGF